MGDEENNFQPSKKRAAGVQLSRDNPGLDDNEDTSELESGTFKRASDEVLAYRRILKVRRQQTSSIPSAPAPASNPFAAIRLVPPVSSALPVEFSVTRKETEQIGMNDIKSDYDVDEPKGESTADEDKTNVNDDSAKQSERKVDDPKAKIDTEKQLDDLRAQNITKTVVNEVAEGENSEDGAKIATRADNIENEARKDVEGKRNDGEKDNGEATIERNAETASFSSFQQLSSSQNAFSGLIGTGFSSTSFSFGSIPKDGSSSTISLFGLKSDQPSFSFGYTDENTSIFGASGADDVHKSDGSRFPLMQEVPTETGEENERAVFTADSVLFEFIDGTWKERGKGELKVNLSTKENGKARLVMRAKRHYRLILNARLFPDMKLTNMDKKGITFTCVNSASDVKDSLSTIALKFKDTSIVEDFRAAVMEHKAKTPVALKPQKILPRHQRNNRCSTLVSGKIELCIWLVLMPYPPLAH